MFSSSNQLQNRYRSNDNDILHCIHKKIMFTMDFFHGRTAVLFPPDNLCSMKILSRLRLFFKGGPEHMCICACGRLRVPTRLHMRVRINACSCNATINYNNFRNILWCVHAFVCVWECMRVRVKVSINYNNLVNDLMVHARGVCVCV